MKDIKKTLTELMGFEPGRDQRIQILRECKESGKSIEEVCDKYALPPLFVIRDDGTFLYNGETMTKEQFNQRFPFRRFVTVGTQSQRDKIKSDKQKK